jgi:hypothetical protein
VNNFEGSGLEPQIIEQHVREEEDAIIPAAAAAIDQNGHNIGSVAG